MDFLSEGFGRFFRFFWDMTCAPARPLARPNWTPALKPAWPPRLRRRTPPARAEILESAWPARLARLVRLARPPGPRLAPAWPRLAPPGPAWPRLVPPKAESGLA